MEKATFDQAIELVDNSLRGLNMTLNFVKKKLERGVMFEYAAYKLRFCFE